MSDDGVLPVAWTLSKLAVIKLVAFKPWLLVPVIMQVSRWQVCM